MAYQCFAVLARETKVVPHAYTEDGRRIRGLIGDREESYGFHATESAAEAARERWATRLPKRKWRVASLVEV